MDQYVGGTFVLVISVHVIPRSLYKGNVEGAKIITTIYISAINRGMGL